MHPLAQPVVVVLEASRRDANTTELIVSQVLKVDTLAGMMDQDP